MPAASSLSECEVTIVASMSSVRRSGRRLAAEAASRAKARALRSSASSSESIDLTTRWAVVSEATAPNRLCWPRSASRSETHSPPSAIATARSRRTRPGSWAEARFLVGAIASESAFVRPVRSASSESRAAPAWETRPSPSAATSTLRPVTFIVILLIGNLRSSSAAFSLLRQTFPGVKPVPRGRLSVDRG